MERKYKKKTTSIVCRFTGNNHEEVFLTGGSLGQILHDVPVALNQLLHLVRLSITIFFLTIGFFFILAALVISLLLAFFLLFGSFLKTKVNGGGMSSSPCGLSPRRLQSYVL